ncbi:MAG: type II toxin-antitoxin system MqsR family toxin [Victivallales bacterium]|nr:type II toxin-antitoxin system MqsR family toxin [Victivallales bacterium]
MKEILAEPYYPLAEVKRLAVSGSVFFARRKDGKADPERMGLTKASACAVIAALAPRDFDLTSYDGPSPADVYKVPMQRNPNACLYIKLQISDEGDLLVVISFHI